MNSHYLSIILIALLTLGGCTKSKKETAEQPKEKAAAPAKVEKEAPPPKPKEKAPEPKEKTAAADTGSIVGTVFFDGIPPPPVAINMSSSPDCTAVNKGRTERQDVLANDGTLPGVFVYVKAGLPKAVKYPPPKEAVTLDQKNCRYQPSLIGLQTGQTLRMVNSDTFMHNVNAKAKRGGFNIAMPTPNSVTEKTFKKPQVLVQFECTVHTWMKAWAGVVSHPFFAISDTEGSFKIPGLPAGSYTVGLVHPTLGAQEAEATVTVGGSAEISARFKAKS